MYQLLLNHLLHFSNNMILHINTIFFKSLNSAFLIHVLTTICFKFYSNNSDDQYLSTIALYIFIQFIHMCISYFYYFLLLSTRKPQKEQLLINFIHIGMKIFTIR